MPRPVTARRVPPDLVERVFKPRGVPMAALEWVTVTLDGLEALRLADVEGLYHEEAADRMGVSRATFSRVLTSARKEVADALINGKAIRIGGGTVAWQPPEPWPCPLHGGMRRRGRGCRCPHRHTEGTGPSAAHAHDQTETRLATEPDTNKEET